MDYIALRVIVLLCAYLFFRPRMDGRNVSALLALLTLLAVMLVLRIARQIRYERYCDKELARLRMLLLRRKLILLSPEALRALVQPLLTPDERCALILRAEPAGADALLPYARKRAPFAVCAPAGFTAAAASFAEQTGGLRLVPDDALLRAARAAGLTPHPDEVEAYLLADAAHRKAQRKKAIARPFTNVASKKYLVTALLLLICSFFSRYTLYCRMLSGLCMSLFAVNAALSRTRTESRGIE